MANETRGKNMISQFGICSCHGGKYYGIEHTQTGLCEAMNRRHLKITLETNNRLSGALKEHETW
ncbi:hypothetical protein PILCRDRAFT_320424 [Piloderma croceum F 1598]|uniref:Uncharacterized protein n=1 Tax=Piloderma croceum (strain F 1598) TaxID=765440 RepID=A0A0C3G6F3_PILCF|nr:hypothetical protein PILCRDRAFT_320424 [Piloderma croceum F 1598]